MEGVFHVLADLKMPLEGSLCVIGRHEYSVIYGSNAWRTKDIGYATLSFASFLHYKPSGP